MTEEETQRHADEQRSLAEAAVAEFRRAPIGKTAVILGILGILLAVVAKAYNYLSGTVLSVLGALLVLVVLVLVIQLLWSSWRGFGATQDPREAFISILSAVVSALAGVCMMLTLVVAFTPTQTDLVLMQLEELDDSVQSNIKRVDHDRQNWIELQESLKTADTQAKELAEEPISDEALIRDLESALENADVLLADLEARAQEIENIDGEATSIHRTANVIRLVLIAALYMLGVSLFISSAALYTSWKRIALPEV